MQLMTDNADGPAALRLAARFLNDLAALTEGENVAEVKSRVSPAGGNFGPAPSAETPQSIGIAELLPTPRPLPHIPPPPPPPVALGAAMGAQIPTAPLERDATGMPWDARIHQKTRGKKLNGEWKVQKNLDPVFVSAVVREISALRAPTPVAEPSPSEVFGKASTVILPPAGVAPLPARIPPPPAAPAPPIGVAIPAPPVRDAAAIQLAFRALMGKLVAAESSGRIDMAGINAIVHECGAPNIGALGVSMSDLIPAVETALAAHLMSVS